VIYLWFDRLARRVSGQGAAGSRAGPLQSGRPVSLPESSIRRPVATVLLTAGVTLAGAAGLRSLARGAAAAGGFPDDLGAGAASGRQSRGDGGDGSGRPSSARSAASPGSPRSPRPRRSASSRVTLQFDLDRDIDGAARDVQAAINAARSQLPRACRATRPTAR